MYIEVLFHERIAIKYLYEKLIYIMDRVRKVCFVYLPYAFAEGIHLSGIMAILFCGIVMSQYTHYNLSPVTQITMQQTMRTVAFVCESCVFAYLGMALFSFPLRFETSLIIWSLIFVLLGRALNIFPLAALSNRWRSHQVPMSPTSL